MEFLPLLKSHLKSNVISELLETWDAQVVYEFDRTGENIPDVYWASVQGEGVCLKFNENQMLDCIFLHLTDCEGFTPIDLATTDIQQFGSMAEGSSFADDKGVPYSTGQGELLGQIRDWIRLEYEDHWIHFEFQGGTLSLVTLMERSITR